ncbi:MAG TPA: hypothetical protein VFI00_00960, partial [Kribbella sp.]|nr:hypothetical protein [Kribbella sp.]
FFTTTGGVLYLLGWLTGPSFLSGNPVACAAIAGAACYPARFLVERFDWWKRLEQPTKRTQARRERARQRALAGAREAAERRRAQGDHGRAAGVKRRRPGRHRLF